MPPRKSKATKRSTGRFEKSTEPTHAGYEYKQMKMAQDDVAIDRNEHAEEGWEPDPTWPAIQLADRYLVVYRRKVKT